MLCNHRSRYDAILLYWNIFRKKYYLAKKEIMTNKFTTWFWTKIGVVPIDRSKADVSAIRRCLTLLKQGDSLVVFPEGTRADDDNMKEFKNGGTMLGIKSGVEILPIYITQKPKFFKRIKIIIGNSFNLKQYEGVKLTKELLDEAGYIILENIKQIEDEYKKNKI